MRNFIGPFGNATVTLTAGEKIAAWSNTPFQVTQLTGYPNYPSSNGVIANQTGGEFVSSAFASGGTVTIQAGAQGAYYESGLTPVVQFIRNSVYQPTPGTLNATGTLTGALILGGIVTSTTGAAVAATLDTGTVMDTVSDFAVGDAIDWSVINTGANTFTVTASSGHTIVGVAAVATVTSARFRTLKTAANTFVTYRLS